MIRFIALGVIASIAPASAAPGVAQTRGGSVQFPAGYAPGSSPCVKQADGSCSPVSPTMPLPVAARQESVVLVAANSAAAAQAVYGGSYTFGQSCAAYNGGSLALRYRGPDGTSMLTLVGKTMSDGNGGATLVVLGSNAIVDVALPAGSVDCVATLARVP